MFPSLALFLYVLSHELYAGICSPENIYCGRLNDPSDRRALGCMLRQHFCDEKKHVRDGEGNDKLLGDEARQTVEAKTALPSTY